MTNRNLSTTMLVAPGVALAVFVGASTLSGCASTGIAIREQLGYAKREQLVARVDDAKDAQTEAKEQFQTTLDKFLEVARSTGGGHGTAELESRYKSLNSEYEECEDRADEVRSRIASVEAVASAMFREWESELSQYSDPNLKAQSQQQLATTRANYDRLVGLMKTAASRMDPVLAKFRDHVLFLKHNLNAAAVASLEGSAARIETDVTALIEEMQRAITEAEAFIGQLRNE
jgi:hypothetical protein